MRTLKHLPIKDWPEADREAFGAAFAPGDIFDEGARRGRHLADGSRRTIAFAYRRWLGFLKADFPGDLALPIADRITRVRVRNFVEHLSTTMKPHSVATVIGHLLMAARLIVPSGDWEWLKSIKARLACKGRPEDRFHRLVHPRETLDFGLELMEDALKQPADDQKRRERQYRDGLLLALLSLWPIRRRSLAALTVSRHIEFDDLGANILLDPGDTKAGRAESFRVPDEVLPYLMRYLREVRPILLGDRTHERFWVDAGGGPVGGGGLYDIVCARTLARFGKAMSLHDFRRAAATYLAVDAPEKVGLIPGILQHASPEVGERHYNLARLVQANRRFADHLAEEKNRLKSRSIRTES